MVGELEFWLLLVLIAAAVLALQVRDLLAAAAIFAAYSFLMAFLFAKMGAPDVAFVEAALGAGVTGVLFIVTIFSTGGRYERRTLDRRPPTEGAER